MGVINPVPYSACRSASSSASAAHLRFDRSLAQRAHWHTKKYAVSSLVRRSSVGLVASMYEMKSSLPLGTATRVVTSCDAGPNRDAGLGGIGQQRRAGGRFERLFAVVFR